MWPDRSTADQLLSERPWLINSRILSPHHTHTNTRSPLRYFNKHTTLAHHCVILEEDAQALLQQRRPQCGRLHFPTSAAPPLLPRQDWQ